MKETLSTDIASQSLRMAMHLLFLSLRENRRFGSANAVALCLAVRTQAKREDADIYLRL